MTKISLSGLIALCCQLAWAQPMGFQHHGNFTHMMRSGEARGQVQLSALDTAPGVWGVGALAGLEGEIIQVDGQLLVSRGATRQGEAGPARAGDTAALWVSAKVSQWVSVPLPSDMGQSELEAFIQAQAEARQIDLAQPFVFRVTGDLAHLVWHVVTGEKTTDGAKVPLGGGHDRANRSSGKKVFRQTQASGQLVGVYSGAELEGVVSHPGERFHVHYVDRDLKTAGHVDQYTVRAGSTLWLALR